jgi:hypothetical protein
MTDPSKFKAVEIVEDNLGQKPYDSKEKELTDAG